MVPQAPGLRSRVTNGAADVAHVLSLEVNILSAMNPDPDIPSLRTFDLSSEGGRMAFLWTLWESYQESGLLMAVNHVWDSLAAPRTRRARVMAEALGLPGGGKHALLQVLSNFLHEVTCDIAMDDLPPREAYPDFDAWNVAALAVFDRFHADWEQVARRYEALLDGRPLPARPVVHLSGASVPAAQEAGPVAGARVLPWPGRA